MKPLLCIIVCCFAVCPATVRGEGQVLKAADGTVGEVRLEMAITRFEKNDHGGASIAAAGMWDGDQISVGFDLHGNWKRKVDFISEGVASLFKVGESSATLDLRLRTVFARNKDDTILLAGYLVHMFAETPAPSKSDYDLCYLFISNRSWTFRLLLDPSFKKLVLYVSEANLGPDSRKAARDRGEVDAKKPEANKAPEPTPPSVTPRASERTPK